MRRKTAVAGEDIRSRQLNLINLKKVDIRRSISEVMYENMFRSVINTT